MSARRAGAHDAKKREVRIENREFRVLLTVYCRAAASRHGALRIQPRNYRILLHKRALMLLVIAPAGHGTQSGRKVGALRR